MGSILVRIAKAGGRSLITAAIKVICMCVVLAVAETAQGILRTRHVSPLTLRSALMLLIATIGRTEGRCYECLSGTQPEGI
jgi:formate hydrogenlyase subunit 4